MTAEQCSFIEVHRDRQGTLEFRATSEFIFIPSKVLESRRIWAIKTRASAKANLETHLIEDFIEFVDLLKQLGVVIGSGLRRLDGCRYFDVQKGALGPLSPSGSVPDPEVSKRYWQLLTCHIQSSFCHLIVHWLFRFARSDRFWRNGGLDMLEID
ncbi:hypothetical protein Tco_1211083 [Tanacetum coccineum]